MHNDNVNAHPLQVGVSFLSKDGFFGFFSGPNIDFEHRQ